MRAVECSGRKNGWKCLGPRASTARWIKPRIAMSRRVEVGAKLNDNNASNSEVLHLDQKLGNILSNGANEVDDEW